MNGQKEQPNNSTRPPVVVVMGHIDHGKSTLLDYIRKTNVVESEQGGITQRISAYEVTQKNEEGVDQKITFLDTPGHEAFSKMRERGAKIADIAILVVSAVEGVKPQTVEAWKTILESNIPCIVAINKIDKSEANIEKTKMELAEHEIYLEGYGGKVVWAPISAKTGAGVAELLSLILILAEMENFSRNIETGATGYVIETHLDQRRGVEATLIVKEGTLKKDMTLAVEDSLCVIKIMEDFLGSKINSVSPSAPVSVVGWNKPPQIGAIFRSFDKKSEAEEYAKKWREKNPTKNMVMESTNKKIIPIILKSDVSGSLEAIEKEIEKIKSENAEFKILGKGAGPISESDIKGLRTDGIAIAFGVKADKSAIELARERGIGIFFFDVIYKMTDWLREEMEKRRPKMETAETTGRAKILKFFSRTKEKQVLGGKVLEGSISADKEVKIMRRDFEIGKGKIVNLEKSKVKTGIVEEGAEFGIMIESKIEIVPGDIVESFTTVQK
ncbi:translation initiation factor IF-2 [Candidatus Nomurabacteria bacterium RIFCSPHIGHO2_02_FULL_41_18]|uniref:Translation initiation factor IF-2 n=1 Tax=Candidatus Nomurabacteria bacterium RIFCSPHIGHO2_02_FULL_41_18 TaxID=1801754 RepID=A0A1F6W7Q3_9BACT|nr:MAG: translation initiation factor IF-2 [Candidatus Nomurabacteria bacterium RIFCSPHIGHO2_01_FULL_41_71]OGI77919.1 MAG: translation initiation factor IF-2 [Candidatus Nomurabacteria bacterium RIFCSPHIGHO2_02_FULL_41_18]OGI90334.1 MAG: translation initiation factor IF-2 [Candidatus Nomurabacteria bacterium RIFCSPLOWO2_01_FULL_41_52b]